MMSTMLLTAVCCLMLSLTSAASAVPGPTSWRSPQETAKAQLPFLERPLTLDGEPTEWEGAVCVPFHSPSLLFMHRGTQRWQGTADMSMELYAAWNSDGVCFAAIVADDELANKYARTDPRKEDDIELYIDGRPGAALLYDQYEKGVYRVFAIPPLGDGGPQLWTRHPGGKIEDLPVAGKRTPIGYTLEMLIPWKMFPEFTPRPGARLGLQFALNDYDSRDGTMTQPRGMSFGAATNLAWNPSSFIECRLVRKLQTGKSVNLGFEAAMTVPRLATSNKPLPVSIDLSAPLSRRTGDLRLTATGPGGKAIGEIPLKLSKLSGLWDERITAEGELSTPSEDGFYALRLAAYDKSGRLLGTTVRSVLILQGTLRDTFDYLQGINLGQIAQAQPFKATVILGLAASLEKLKRAHALIDAPAALEAACEIAARRDVLEDGKLTPGDWGRYDLLALTGDPEAQVVVEYPYSTESHVTFYWGAIPLASAKITDNPLHLTAEGILKASRGAILIQPSALTAIDGHPACITAARTYALMPCTLSDFAPETQVLLVDRPSEYVYLLDRAYLSRARPDAAAIGEDCSPSIRDLVIQWAKANAVPITTLERAARAQRHLIAGSIQGTSLARELVTFRARLARPAEPTLSLTVLDGGRIIEIQGPSIPVSKQVARMVLAGRPVTSTEVDALRRELVRALAPEGAASSAPEGTPIRCGDLHMHSFSSTAWPTPVAVALKTIHCFMDFAAMTDHGPLDGAQIAQRLLKSHGFEYPFAVGQEIITGWAHFNAYPLKELISTTLPLEGIVNAAHAQGAVIQWNHPGSPASPWAIEQLKRALVGTELDAMEHYPDDYRLWKRIGILPVITGTTDSNRATFEWPERTLILSPVAAGEDIAAAIRQRKVIMISPEGGQFLYGSDESVASVWAALAEGAALKKGKADRIREALHGADLIGILRESPATP